MTKNEILTFLKENKTLMEKKYKVKKMALFGSFARDEADENSDIDILVDMSSSFDNFFELKYFLESSLKKRVDLGRFRTMRRYIFESIKKDVIHV